VQAEIGHADRVSVRVAKGDTERRTAVDGVTFFGRELFLGIFYNSSIHENRNLAE
jgi:hypothetical protein